MSPDLYRRVRGFVLPTTMMVLTLLTVMLTAAFILVSAEFRTTDNSMAMTRAHALASAGLQDYFSLNRVMLGTYDSIRITLSGGYTDVVAKRLRDSTDVRRALWLVRASGFSTDPFQPGQVQALRTVAQLAERNPAEFPAQAALFAPNGVHVPLTGSTNPILGNDISCSPSYDKPGLVTLVGGYTSAVVGPPSGSPGVKYFASASEVIDSTYVDWPALIGGNFTPDYQLPSGLVSWNTNAVILVVGDYTMPVGLPNPATGMLVVTGNLTLTNGVHWHGVILTGGYVLGVGDYRVHGMLISGLNISLGQVVPPDTIPADQNAFARQVHWRSCEYLAAIQSLAALVPLGNAWSDTWSSY